MTKTFCDICNKVLTNDDWTGIRVTVGNDELHYDICRECKATQGRKIQALIKKGKNEQNILRSVRR